LKFGPGFGTDDAVWGQAGSLLEGDDGGAGLPAEDTVGVDRGAGAVELLLQGGDGRTTRTGTKRRRSGLALDGCRMPAGEQVLDTGVAVEVLEIADRTTTEIDGTGWGRGQPSRLEQAIGRVVVLVSSLVRRAASLPLDRTGVVTERRHLPPCDRLVAGVYDARGPG
jgi:hypothetical protein